MSHFLSELSDNYAIAEYIESTSIGYVDREYILEYFRGTNGILKTIPIAQIEEGKKEGNIEIPTKTRAYLELPLNSMPPVIIENYIVIDGNHRLRVAKKLGAKEMLCYVIELAE